MVSTVENYDHFELSDLCGSSEGAKRVEELVD